MVSESTSRDSPQAIAEALLETLEDEAVEFLHGSQQDVAEALTELSDATAQAVASGDGQALDIIQKTLPVVLERQRVRTVGLGHEGLALVLRAGAKTVSSLLQLGL